jgi:hypothetical protein
MNKKIVRLIEKVRHFEMLDGRVLIHPLKLRTYEVEDSVKDDEANRGKNPMLEELKMKRKILTINYAYQEGVVLNVPANIINIKVGDRVVYRINNLQEFDLIKGVSMLKSFEIVAIVGLKWTTTANATDWGAGEITVGSIPWPPKK